MGCSTSRLAGAGYLLSNIGMGAIGGGFGFWACSGSAERCMFAATAWLVR